MARTKAVTGDGVEHVAIPEPRMNKAHVTIVGIAPLMIHRFSEKTRTMLEAKMAEGDRSKNRRSRDARDFDADYENARYFTIAGWDGIPASSFRNSFISACRVSGYPMTRAKLSLFVEADGYDREDGTPLVRITKGVPQQNRTQVRNATGVVDVRCRPLWLPGWEAKVSVEYDSQQFGPRDVLNLVARAGLQVGVCEGRPDSKQSNGMGYGRWRVAGGVSEGVPV